MGKAQASKRKLSAAKFEHGDKLTPERAKQLKGRLDVPTPERVAKSASGFDVSVLVEGHIPVIRAREKSILTPPEVRREMIAEAISDLKSRGILEVDGSEIRIKETAADRLLNPVEHEAICRYIQVHAKVTSGHAQIGNYGQKTRRAKGSEDDHDKVLVDVSRLVHAELQKVLPEAHLAFLDWLAWHEFPSMRDGVAPSQIDVGRQIIDCLDARRAQGGIEGFLRAVAQNISHWEGEIETIQRRKDLVKKEISAHRKKALR